MGGDNVVKMIVCTGLNSKSWHFGDFPNLMLHFEQRADQWARYLWLWLATLQMGELQSWGVKCAEVRVSKQVRLAKVAIRKC
jgi:hypothetical protein